MYRVIRIRPDGWDILTRGKRYNGFSNVPVFTSNATDKRINEYETKDGALKAAWKLRRFGYNMLVIDAETGKEIEESADARQVDDRGEV